MPEPMLCDCCNKQAELCSAYEMPGEPETRAYYLCPDGHLTFARILTRVGALMEEATNG